MEAVPELPSSRQLELTYVQERTVQMAITEEQTRSDAAQGFLFQHPTRAAADVSALSTRTGDE